MTNANPLLRKYRFFFAIFALLMFSNAYAVEYYRADSRSPEEIRAQGGFVPRAWGRVYTRETMVDTSLYRHALGAVQGARDDSGYVSTSRSLDSATAFGNTMLDQPYYIYVIAQAPNLVDVNAILRQYSASPHENEFAAMGRVPFSQIIGWHRMAGGTLGPLVVNADYRADVFGNQPAADPNSFYALAGFPSHHPAWWLEPWNAFAPDGCQVARTRNITNCSDSKSKLVRAKRDQINAFFTSNAIGTLSPSMAAIITGNVL